MLGTEQSRGSDIHYGKGQPARPKEPLKAIETRECTRTLPFGLEIQLLVLHDVNGPVSNHHEKRTIEPRPFDAEFTSIFISVACLPQKFISITRAVAAETRSCFIAYVSLAFLLTTRRSLLEISSAAINTLIL